MLSLNGVTYKYRTANTPAVSGVSCEFENGMMYAIAGPSGSGKSTLLSMLAGLDIPTEGEILFNGNRLADMDLDLYRRQDISMIFQSFQLLPLLTALENVCYPMELCGIRPVDARHRAVALLQGVGIKSDQMKRYPSRLSGGEQQRIAIARSLATGAKTILADEPTGNLDEANSKNIMGILRGLSHDSGYCVVVVTHDMESAAIADAVYRMKDGMLCL